MVMDAGCGFGFAAHSAIYAGNEVMGEIQFEGRSKVERTSGVWVDGGYVGYLKELKGSKKVLLLPGEHVISVKQDGYHDFTERVVVQAGTKVCRSRGDGESRNACNALGDGNGRKLPSIRIEPRFLWTGSSWGPWVSLMGQAGGMLVVPGTHKIRVALPGV